MALEVFTVGEVLTAASLNESCVNTRYASKPADTSRASTTTLANDPDLTLPVDASKSYYLLANIIFTGAATNGDIKFAFTVPASTVFSGSAMSYAVTGGTLTLSAFGPSGGLITGTASAIGAASIAQVITYSGVLTTSATAGNLVFQWAQNTSNGTGTVVKQGSSLFLRRVS